MRTITASTRLLGVLGNPIRHSLSPIIQNAAIAEMGLDWCYLAIPCNENDLEIIIQALSKMNYKGLNITIPHKKNTLKLCSNVTQIAKRIGAVNTLTQEGNNTWNGTNTDVTGFIMPLKKHNWKNKTALILGCGGSAGAVVEGVQILGFKEVRIVGRNQEKLKAFMKDIKGKYNDIISSEILYISNQKNIELIESIKESDLIINTTPIGMKKEKSDSSYNDLIPMGESSWENLQKESLLYDLIYTPRPTPWLKIGQSKGCNTIDGLEMLIQQGAASLSIWSGFNEMPIDIMRKSAYNFLKKQA